ncbi:MAG: hypothetical protein K2K58_05835, partial [Muribaculaceae bacterium]|nr:hypothetical protein [Muribaculaceae bacterium]
MLKHIVLSIAFLLSATSSFANSGSDSITAQPFSSKVAHNVPSWVEQINSQLDSVLYVSENKISPVSSGKSSFLEWCSRKGVADHLDASFTLGTGGLGLEVATPLTKWATLRAGIEWMPSFNIPLNFELSSFSENGATNDVSHIQEMVKDLMGLDMDDKVTMNAKPNMLNFKLLVDVFPFQNNRHWHFTAGFYLGSPVVGRAKNTRGETQTLVGVNIYNRAYRYFTSPDFDPYMVAIGNGTFLDPELAMEYHDKFERYGSVGIHIGDYKDGKPYLMEPTKDGRVSAKAVTNNFRPYLGFGYSSTVDKDKRLSIGFDAGVLFWGGAPNVILHDGVNMTKDLVNIRGKVGSYMDFIKALPVYP